MWERIEVRGRHLVYVQQNVIAAPKDPSSQSSPTGWGEEAGAKRGPAALVRFPQNWGQGAIRIPNVHHPSGTSNA